MSSPLTNDTTAPENAARAKRLGHARWLVASNALDAGGRSATDVAIDVLAVLVLGVGAAQMGVLMTLSGLGFLLLAVPIGILVDRHLGPRLLVATDLAKAALLGTLVLAWALDALTFAHLAAVMALLGVLTVLAETTQATLVPRVVAPDTVSRLAARLESADAALGLIVPAAAGLLVAALGAGPVLGIAAAFLAAAALVALKVRMNPAPVTEDTRDEETPAAAVVLTRWSRFWSEAAHGWTTLRRTPVLWLLTLNSMAGNIGMALFAPIEAVWVLTDLQLGPEFVGFQLTAGALGALTVSALAPPCHRHPGREGMHPGRRRRLRRRRRTTPGRVLRPRPRRTPAAGRRRPVGVHGRAGQHHQRRDLRPLLPRGHPGQGHRDASHPHPRLRAPCHAGRRRARRGLRPGMGTGRVAGDGPALPRLRHRHRPSRAPPPVTHPRAQSVVCGRPDPRHNPRQHVVVVGHPYPTGR